MLCIVEIGRAAPGNDEVPTRAQLPKNAAVAGAVSVVDFNYPILVPHGKNQVSIVWRVDYRVRMGPIRKTERLVINVKVVKSGPDPDRLSVLVKINQSITLHKCCTWAAR